jgi:hypothetical protein
VQATGKRRWHRIKSVAALRQIGREFRNCLARVPHAEHHAACWRGGWRQYWVLRDADGMGLVAAMADAPCATHFIEIRGPNNSTVRNRQVDLMRLAKALGIACDPWPPPEAAGLMGSSNPSWRRGAPAHAAYRCGLRRSCLAWLLRLNWAPSRSADAV